MSVRKKLDQLQEKIQEAHRQVQEDLAKTSNTVTQATARMRARLERASRRNADSHPALKAVTQ
ncbi:MAG: hypothetical protein ACYC1Z_14270 [Georgenia sp.]